jgi:urease accessory protein UreE
VYKLGGMTIVEIHILALRDLLVQPAATCTPIPLAIKIGDIHTPAYVKVYANGELVATKLVAAEEPPIRCKSCIPQ